MSGRRILVGLGCAILVAVMMSAFPHAGGGNQDRSRLVHLQGEARKRGGLEAAAAVSGSFSAAATFPGDGGGPLDLAELAMVSDVVVIGKATAAHPVLVENGRSIKTIFDVEISEVLKGGRGQSRVSVKLPGGRVRFANGTWAELIPYGFPPPRLQSRQVWFLRRNAGGDEPADLYELASGPLGLYDLDNYDWVRPSGNYKSPLAVALQHRRFTSIDFVSNLKTVLSKH